MDLLAAFTVIILWALPFFEARYAIPAAILYGFFPLTAFALGVVKNIQRYGAPALFLSVALPVPVTGTWSGCAPGFVFGIRFREASPAIICGTVTAALITTLPLRGLIHAFGGA